MCFGLRVGPMQFNRVSEFIYSILSDLYGIQVVNFLDDFIAARKPNGHKIWLLILLDILGSIFHGQK